MPASIINLRNACDHVEDLLEIMFTLVALDKLSEIRRKVDNLIYI